MRRVYKRYTFFRALPALMLAVAALLAVVCLPVPDAVAQDNTADDYRAVLRAQGFPESYIEGLYELHLLHPEWSFEPLMVTGLNSKYTWDYCIHMETDDNPKRSLVSASAQFKPYRHATNTTPYDSGWYQASADAVRYFMDPRNFLNEKDIFQFEDLRFRDSVTISQVGTALAGTFMEGARLENGKTYAEYFYEVGRELGLNPIHLASRARQEQGGGRGAQISGEAGERLWYYYSNHIQTENGGIVYAPATGHSESELKGYNGLYNFYNIGAAGTGRFAILLGAMKEAKSGTPEMAEKWGGSPSWDTRWKSIYGGAYKLAKSYIGNYQNTLYLQKWNVDNRSKSSGGGSRNFWGQYMQNIGAALSEARNSYTALAAGDCLDCPFTFVIPVYSGMPGRCPDPAGGECAYYAVSTSKYSSRSRLSMYTDVPEAVNTYVRSDSVRCAVGGTLNVSGTSLHSAVPEAFEYSIDGGAWVALRGRHDGTLSAAEPEFAACLAADVPNMFDAEVPIGALGEGSYTLAIRGRVRFDAADTENNNCRYYLVAEIPVSVSAGALRVTVNDGTSERQLEAAHGGVFTLPAAPAPRPDTAPGMTLMFAGWAVSGGTGSATGTGSTSGTGADEQLLPAGASLTLTSDAEVRAVFVSIGMRYGASAKLGEVSALRFNGIVGYDGYEELRRLSGGRVSCGLIICQTPEGTPDGTPKDGRLATLSPAELEARSVAYRKTVAVAWRQSAGAGGYYAFSGDTEAISPSERGVSYSATAYVKVAYSNGESADIVAPYSPDFSRRSVGEVLRRAGK